MKLKDLNLKEATRNLADVLRAHAEGRLEEHVQQKLMEQKNKGTYAGVHFDKNTTDRIKAFIEANNIPNAAPSDKLHTTVLYSRKYLPNYEPAGDVNMTGKPLKFEKWLTQADDKGYRASALVLTYVCPELVNRHKELMKEHDATFDYDEFKPHITLSYDIGREFDTKKLDPKDIGDLNIINEYGEDLNLDWAKDNT